MIGKEEFIAGMSALGGAFGREVEAPVQRMYYAVLSPRLTTEEFTRAVETVVTRETFWPSPAVILCAVKADSESRALAAFEHVNRVTGAHGGYRFLTAAVFHAEFDAPTKAAISAVGGLPAIANTAEEQWPRLQRRFIEAHEAALRPQQPKLVAPAADDGVTRLVGATAARLSGRDRALGRDA